jgi:ribosome-binding ATPase YchF (GTP1/OBG family)
MLDVAGLVPDAWQGRGLGNKFLNDLSRADGLIHVIDASGSLNSEGQEVEGGSWDPQKDVIFLNHEIHHWIVNILQRDWRKLIGQVELEKGSILNALEEKLSGLGIRRAQIEDSLRKADLRVKKPSEWGAEDFLKFAGVLQKVAKPMVIAANKMDREHAPTNLESLQKSNSEPVIPCCALGEYAFRTFGKKGIIKYQPGDASFTIEKKDQLNEASEKLLNRLKEEVLDRYKSTGVQKCIDSLVYDTLRYIVVYPIEDVNQFTDHHGNILPDALLVPEGTTTQELAYRVHTDLGETFIHAIDGRTKKRLSGDHVLKNQDIIKIVAASGRK